MFGADDAVVVCQVDLFQDDAAADAIDAVDDAIDAADETVDDAVDEAVDDADICREDLPCKSDICADKSRGSKLPRQNGDVATATLDP